MEGRAALRAQFLPDSPWKGKRRRRYHAVRGLSRYACQRTPFRSTLATGAHGLTSDSRLARIVILDPERLRIGDADPEQLSRLAHVRRQRRQ
jgi:hypothetical protein